MFDFDSSKVTVKICLAALYTPKVLEASIKKRPYNAIIYVVSGKYDYTFKGNSFTARSGEAFFLPANLAPYEYAISSEEEKELCTLQVEFEIKDAQTGAPLRFSERPEHLRFLDRVDFEQSMRALIASYTSSLASSRYETVSELYKIFSLCEKAGEIDIAKNAKKNIAPAIKYIEENYNKRINVEELSSLAGISQSQLRRNFNEVFGISPMKYRRMIVLKMAKQMIKTGEFKISEISEMLGFVDIYEFSHFFAKETGLSPKEYYKTHN